MNLHLAPIPLAAANAYVDAHHRHNAPVSLGAIFTVAIVDDLGVIQGALIAGRPVARALCDGWTLEVLRTCTEGAPNANSMLYGAAWRAARALGYRRLITYTQQSETGASLRAAGFVQAASLGRRVGWDTPSRGRDNARYPASDRWRWEITCGPPPVTDLQLALVDDSPQPLLFDEVAS